MRIRASGATLIEVVVALAVFALVTTLIATVFTLAHRYTRVGHQLSGAERECVRCCEGIAEILRSSRTRTLSPATAMNVCWTLSSVPPATSPRITQFDSVTGELLYHKWQGIWCQGDGQVYTSELPLAGGAAPYGVAMLATAPTSLSDFQTAARRSLLAKSIRNFSVSKVGADLLLLSVESQTTESGNPATRYQLSSSVPAQ